MTNQCVSYIIHIQIKLANYAGQLLAEYFDLPERNLRDQPIPSFSYRINEQIVPATGQVR